jgi:hypothetical protein
MSGLARVLRRKTPADRGFCSRWAPALLAAIILVALPFLGELGRDPAGTGLARRSGPANERVFLPVPHADAAPAARRISPILGVPAPVDSPAPGSRPAPLDVGVPTPREHAREPEHARGPPRTQAC